MHTDTGISINFGRVLQQDEENWTDAMPNFRTLRSLFLKKTTHSPLVVSVHNFINSQVSNIALSLSFFLKKVNLQLQTINIH